MGSRVRWLIAAVVLAALTDCAPEPAAPAVVTLRPGVVTIAITGNATDDLDPEAWMNRYAERLAADLGLKAEWMVVPFDRSWELAGKDVVDVVATNLANFPDRVSPGGTFSSPFLYEQRALRIRAADREQYRTIADFTGRKIGAVTGMAAHRDLLKRAPAGVEVVAAGTFPDLYAMFDRGQLDAVAQAEYFTLDGRVIPSYGPELALIDHHDLNPGQREESVFVVRDRSTGLLEAVNAFVARTPFPLHLAR
ncbi:MAG: transporter substrate-binding domain-containing protein [Vicinamibacterales bacterium]